MARYHNLFYRVFTLGGIVYFSIALFLGVIISIFPQSECIKFISMGVTGIPGMILFILAIILVSAIMVCLAKKTCAFLGFRSARIRFQK